MDSGSNSENTAHGATVSNNNLNVNNFYGSVHTIINSNPISNYVIYGPIPKESVRSAVPFDHAVH